MLKFIRYEKQGNLIGNEYFLHAYGPIYVLSAEIVASLASARNGRFENAFSIYLTLKVLTYESKLSVFSFPIQSKDV